MDNQNLTEEIEVYEGRFQANKDQIAQICDNFIRNRYYDGISFRNIQSGWEENRHIYYGIRSDDDVQIPYARTLGYVEVSKLHRLSTVGVRVRIVCVWPPLLRYWEELPQILTSLFSTITEHARITQEDGQRTIKLARRNAGRKPDKFYDRAYQLILDGEAYEDVYTWYCNQEGIQNPNKYDRKRFKEAIKRRDTKGKL